MIEFNGLLTGKAEKRFIWITRITMIYFFYIYGILLLFACYTVYQSLQEKQLTWLFLAPTLSMFFMPWIPITKKTRAKIIPYKIVVSKNTITRLDTMFNKSFYTKDVKKVLVADEYYELKLPLSRCICQKSLLTKGTLEEFEEIFKDKLVYKN